MGGMKVSIPGVLGPRIRGKAHNWMFHEFMKHLKMLRDDAALHKDFFDAYVFDDEKMPAEEGQAQLTTNASPARSGGTA
jgi:hypothetical protein